MGRPASQGSRMCAGVASAAMKSSRIHRRLMASIPITIADLRWHPYRVPFRRPIATAHGTLEAREGAIVEVVTDAGTVGVGEIAPPPGFGRTLEEALAPLPALAAAIRTRPRDHPLKAALEQPDLPPATRFGLATA